MRYLIFLLTLGGCTTTGELSKHEPRATYMSDKSIPKLSECFLLEIRRGLPTVVNGESETTMIWGTVVAAGLMITMQKKDTGTQIQVRELAVFTSKNAIERCL